MKTHLLIVLVFSSLFSLAFGNCGNCDDACDNGYYCADCDGQTCGCYLCEPIPPAQSRRDSRGYVKFLDCNQDISCGGDNTLCDNTIYQGLMCLICPSACSLCLVCNKTVDIPVEYNCMGIPFEYNNVSYCLYTQSMGFDDAEKFCQRNGTSIQTQGHIAGIQNAFANSYLVGQLKGHNISEAWIGAITIPDMSEFYYFPSWNDGSIVGYTNFGNDQDIIDLSELTINAEDGQWYVRERASNKGNRPFICQLPKIHK